LEQGGKKRQQSINPKKERKKEEKKREGKKPNQTLSEHFKKFPNIENLPPTHSKTKRPQIFPIRPNPPQKKTQLLFFFFFQF